MHIRRVLVGLAALALCGVPALRAQASFNAMWGSGPNDIWVAGDAPAALHFDGRTWNEVPFGVSRSGSINAIWGAGANDVFAVGGSGMILRYSGSAWASMASPTDRELVAVGGRSASDVYAVSQSWSDRDPGQLLHYDGRAWSATPLPVAFRPVALAIVGADVVVAGYGTNDPRPTERRTVGVLARMSGGRWTLSGWNGQAVTDPVIGGAGWRGLYVSGATMLLYGDRDDGTLAIAMSSGGVWSMLPPAASAMSRTQVKMVFMAAEGAPVALYDGPGLARYAGGRWTPVVPTTPQQMMMQQMQQPQGQPPTPQQMQQLQQMMANPMMMAMQMAAWDMSDARAAWGASSNDFYVATSAGRVVHVVGPQATIVYDAACSDPMVAGMNPICQMLQQQQIR